MKKGFLQTFIVLGILGVFLIGGLLKTNAATTFPTTSTGDSLGSTWSSGSTNSTNSTSNTKTTTTNTQYDTFGFGSGSNYGTGESLTPNNTYNSGGSFPVNYNYGSGQGNGTSLKPSSNAGGATTNPPAGTTNAGGGVTVEGASTSWTQHDDGPFEEALQTAYSALLIGYSKLITWVVGLTGKIFDLTLSQTTSSEGKAYKSIDKGVSDSWKIIRDLSNIILVFSLLYLGIKTIIDGQGFAEKKVLVGIIMAAVLINFSLVFVRDIAFNLSNTIGIQIMEQSKTDSSFSESFMSIVNPQVVIQGQWGGNKSEQAKNLAYNSTWQMLMSYTGQMMMLSFVLICLGFIFIGVSLMLIYRFLIFIVLMIFSPIGLISTQIPWLKNLGKDWIEQLKKQSLFFPAFTLILYIVLYIVSTLILSDPIRLNLTDPSSVFAFVFRFILIIGFMIGLLILPGKVGMVGSDLMTKSGGFIKNKVRNIPRSTAQFGGRMAVSGTARVGRQLGGRAVGSLSENKALKKFAQGKGMLAGAARQTLRGADGLKNSTYDIRNTKLGAKLGMGKGISTWSDTIKKKQEKLEDTKKKEFELFGYDKMGKTDTDKAEIAVAEGERDKVGGVLSAKKAELKAAQTRGASISEIKAITDEMSKLEKDLEDKEVNVGALKNKGNSEYIKLMQRRQKRWTIKGKFNTVERLAIEKLEKEMSKKWKEEGKYQEKKKKKEESTNTNTSSQPRGSTNYITLPPNLPRPTGL